MKSSPSEIVIYDSTLRDGVQGGGVSFSTEDKLRIAERLDDLGIDYIEGGFPGSNPKDIEFFSEVPKLRLGHSVVTAFGSTRKASRKASEDENLKMLVHSGVSTAAIFGKSWKLHVFEVLQTTLDENLRMIEESVAFLKSHGLRVIYDAEHFFDGFKTDADYAIRTLQAAAAGGAECLVLCDTNGGSLVSEVQQALRSVRENLTPPLGIHTHNDSGLAVANSVAAVEMGVRHVQGTLNGYGERCGNANLCTIIPTLELKLNRRCLLPGRLDRLTSASQFVSQIANLPHEQRQAYVGEYAFSHKGGMHVDGVLKNPRTFEHVPPERVGNRRFTLLSDVSGRGTLLERVRMYQPKIAKNAPEIRELVELVKRLEHEGYQFESAEGSFELHVMKIFKQYQELFHKSGFRIIVEKGQDDIHISEATIKVQIGDRVIHTAAEGNGPVNALDQALRKAIAEIYPEVNRIRLVNYKVRILEDMVGTAAKVRVLIESTDGEHLWGTVGVSENIIEASWEALVDSIEYGLLYRRYRRNGKTSG
ncbi:MAG: citramalate synthase [Planctomycetes bacterium]|nr:citramalate synthase [Planctomycetota bacterium]